METLGLLFEHGGAAMYAIALGSVLSLALGIERALFFRRFAREKRSAMAALLRGPGGAATETLVTGLAASGRVGAGLAEVVRRSGSGEDAGAKEADRLRRRWGAGLRRGLWLQGTLGATMPFVGLYGTVVGVLGAFDDIRRSGTSGFAVVAGSISEALITTAGGIAVAVEAVVLFNITSALAGRLAFEAGLELEEVVERLSRRAGRETG